MKIVFAAIIAVGFGLGLQTNWELKIEKDGISVYTAADENSSFKKFKLLATLDATVNTVATIIADVEHGDRWAESVEPGKIIKRISPSEFIFTQELKMPFPFTNRILIQRCVITTQPNGNVRIEMAVDKDAFTYTGDLVVVPYSKGYWFIEQNGEQVDLEYSFLVDPGGNIPAWLVNTFLVDNPYNSIKNLKVILAQKG